MIIIYTNINLLSKFSKNCKFEKCCWYTSNMYCEYQVYKIKCIIYRRSYVSYKHIFVDICGIWTIYKEYISNDKYNINGLSINILYVEYGFLSVYIASYQLYMTQ